jgi:hypothetical protein
MGWFSSTWSDQTRSNQRAAKARKRAAKARRRKDWVQHPVRTAWRSR